MASFAAKDIEEANQDTHRFDRAITEGQSYKVSKRTTLSDGEQLIMHVIPSSVGGTVHIETPAVSTPRACDIDVYENATPTHTQNDFVVHGMRHDNTANEPQANVTRVTDGNLTTTDAIKTEETRIVADKLFNKPGGEDRRGLWRTVPVNETVSFVLTDQSGGANNDYAFDTVIYEGDIFPE